MKRKNILLAGILVLFVISLSSCMPGSGNTNPENPANFLWGIWHGWIAPISLVVSFFRPEITIYDCHNTGLWYNIGYYMAVVGGFGGLSLIRKDKHRKRNK